MSNTGISSVTRVLIPCDLHKLIQDIKEIFVDKHSEDDIYDMLRGSNMDPNETVQKLLNLEENSSTMSGGGESSVSGVPIPSSVRKTILDIKEIAAGKHSDDDIYSMLKECNMDPNETVQKLLYLDTFHEVKRKREKRNANVGRASEEYRWAPGMQRQGARGGLENNCSSNVSDDSGGRRQVSARINNYAKRNFKPSAALRKRENNEAPVATNSSTSLMNDPTNVLGLTAPHPTETSTILPGIRSEGVSPASVSGVYSSSSDPILVPSMSPRNPGAVGIIKRAKGTLENATESMSFAAPSETTNFSSTTGASIPLAVMVSQAEAVMFEYRVPSPPNLNVAVLDQATPEIDRKLEKLSISSHRPVIFPDHLQVPEALRKGLTFGSLDATLGQTANCEKVSTLTSENFSATDLAGREPSQSNHCASTTDEEGEHSNCPPSHPKETEKLSTLGDNASSGAAPSSDQSKQDMLAPVGGSQYPLLQTAPDYSFGFVPSVLGPHFVHLEGAEPQGGDSIAPSTSCSTPPVPQPSGLGQSSFAFPPQWLPFLRQPYPSNFIPYNPYFPQLYMPHNAHQFLGHSVLPQQPMVGNLHVPPTAAVKFPVPPLYRAGTIAGNQGNFGIPSGYGSYGASAVGYSPSPAFTSGSSGGSENLAASELKEQNIYLASNQNEELYAWSSAPERDVSTLQANYFYNIPPGQRVAFSPAHSGHGPFPGVYPLSQTLAAPSTVQSLPQPSPATAGSMEYAVPTSTYQQPNAQFNWNSRILNRENI